MRGRLAWIAAVVAAFATAAVVVGVGSAGLRAAEVTFDAFPGPAEVSFGENIAYRFTFKNISGATLTHVQAHQRYPVAQGLFATPVDSTCPSTPTTISTPDGPEWICDFGNQAADAAPLALTVVWQVPTLPSNTNCIDCLDTNGRFTVDEHTNDVDDGNDAFPPGGITVTASLLASGAGGTELLRAGGYETAPASCADPTGPGNLRTNPVISLTNPVSTTICLPPFSPSATDLGHAATLTEFAGDVHSSNVCVAALGTNCPTTVALAANFAPDFATHIFRIADAALEKGDKIEQVFHNGVLLSACPDTNVNGCVVSITLDNKTKVWTIVALSPTNGEWGWD